MPIITGDDSGNDLIGGADADQISGLGGQDYILGGAGNDVIDTGDAPNGSDRYYYGDAADGGDGDDLITGGGGNDTLIGGLGSDRLEGGEGADTLDGGGADLVMTTQTYFMSGQQVTVRIPSFRSVDDGVIDHLYGGAGADNITVGLGDVADGGEGWDSLAVDLRMRSAGLNLDLRTDPQAALTAAQGGALTGFESFTVYGSNLGDRIIDGEDAGTLMGFGGDDVFAGNGGDDLLIGGLGADVLRGGDGADSIYMNQGLVMNAQGSFLLSSIEDDGVSDYAEGGAGNDYISIGWRDRAHGGEGIDTLYVTLQRFAVGVTLDLRDDAHAAIAALLGATVSGFERFNVWGSAFDDLIFGNEWASNLSGGAGDDVIHLGRRGLARGSDGDDRLFGSLADDLFYGGHGSDTFVGGGGGDVFYGDLDGVSGEVAAPDTDVDTVIYDANYLDHDIYGDGDGLFYIYGPGGSDYLEGIEQVHFADRRMVLRVAGGTYEGWAGIDDVAGGDADETVSGAAGDDVINGAGGADVLNGDAGADRLSGGDGDDILDGGEGADWMAGGAGHDAYGVDSTGDIIVEAANEGIDIVYASISFSLVGTELERVVLMGDARINAAGNAYDNLLIGNNATNALSGGAGADIMRGLGGSDVYTVDNVNDQVIEEADAGIDLVKAGVTWTLGANVENLTLVTTRQINAIGNELNNTIVGNDRPNVIIGMGGRDLMTGNGGADRFDFRAVSDSPFAAYDRITDLADEDVINLSGIDANTNVAGDQAFVLVSAFTRQAGQLTLTYNAAAGFTVLAADVNGDGVGDFRVILDGDHRDYDNFRL